MKRFLFTSIIFLSPLILLLCFFEIKLAQAPNTYAGKRFELEKRLGEIEILTVGSSHGGELNPLYFDYKGFNLSNGGQSLYYDTQLISRYVDRMPNLKLVIMPVSYYSLEYDFNSSLEESLKMFYFRYFDIPPYGETVSLLELRRYSYLAQYGQKVSLRLALKGFKVENTQIDENGWKPENSIVPINQNTGLEKVRAFEAFMNVKNLPTNSTLLGGILDRLTRKNVRVAIITTPVFHTYSDNISDEKYQRMQQAIKQLITQREHQTRYFNYLNDGRFALNDFYDDDHLNTQGSEKLSRIVNEEVIRFMLGR